MEEIGSHQKSMCPDAEMDELWLGQAPEGGEDAQGERIDPPGHEGPGSEVVGAAAGQVEAPESRKVAVGAAEAPRPRINSLRLPPAPEGGEDAQGQRIEPPGHEGPGSEVVGAAAGPGEGLERWEMAVGAAEAPRPGINSLSPPPAPGAARRRWRR